VPPKAKIPAPIDRPLSRAYLREFNGWSTAYPPGLSDSTSLRIMENVMVNRDKSVRVRPGMRYLSYTALPDTALSRPIVGTHEPFFLNDGTKAYLFAVREVDETVGFRVLANTASGQVVISLTAAGFSIPQGEPNAAGGINFKATTTYVKYLQIDNKIFALSDAGEMMRLFHVGTSKIAKRLNAIERPEWAVADKLTVVHPTQAWINGLLPTSTRTNLAPHANMEDITGWNWDDSITHGSRSSTVAERGTYSLRLETLPERTNLCVNPLMNLPTSGLAGWVISSGVSGIAVSGSSLRATTTSSSTPGRYTRVTPSTFPVKVGQKYEATFDLTAYSGIDGIGVGFRWYNSAGTMIGSEYISTKSESVARHLFLSNTVPTGAVTGRIYIIATTSTSGVKTWDIKNVMINKSTEVTNQFSGDSGAGYFWTGTPNNSASVYHPAKTLQLFGSTFMPVVAGTAYVASAYFRSSATARNCIVNITWYNASGGVISQTAGTGENDSSSAWNRCMATATAPAGATSAALAIYVQSVNRDEYHYVDSVLFEKGSTELGYFDGGTTDTTTLKYDWAGTANSSTSTEKTFAGSPAPAAATKTTNTLIHSTPATNTYNFGFFYTFSNEVGDTAASMVTVVRTQRGWPAWRWETPNAAAEPSGTATLDPEAAADQLVAIIPSAVFAAAIDQGAVQWNLFAFTWSDQEPVPVTAVRIGTRPIAPGAEYTSNSWLRMTPQMADAGDETAVLPKAQPRFNYSDPPRGGQGLVAADRMVIVKDYVDPAKIRWTSNQQGSYTDFSASRGGGYKTLTSGNLYIPATVKLWQNPQSADTLTILCMGVDGHSTGYYMAPAQVASQSEAVNVMGFEETTATPGTTSPYGCEIFNNALYHPLDDQLMKSTATNYNINHKAQTDKIENVWKKLVHKEWIVSSMHDGRLYYIVNNPDGEPLEDGCNGNEVWVFDGGGGSAETGGGSWSRWMIQAHSLRKVEQGGQVYMSVIRPSGIYYFDETYGLDDYVDAGVVKNRAITWKLETNTQGANRAHDAWAHLQQVGLTIGNFQGSMRYGVRSYDLHGKPVEYAKLVTDTDAPGDLSFDLEDHLQVRRDLKEWFFFAESIEVEGVPQPTFGQISVVQYRYTPVSVNVGYEYGSIETFEYGRSEALGSADTLTTNGTPRPYIDTRRP
jgi:hypothetical protein